MLEVYGDLWDYPADIRVITTNGVVRNDGCLVMGRGCAAQAKSMFPGIDRLLGDQVTRHGNVPIRVYPQNIATLPVKHRWDQPADPELIVSSTVDLVALLDRDPAVKRVVMPRPGCGNGQLQWQNVKPLIEQYLDDRFFVIDLRP